MATPPDKSPDRITPGKASESLEQLGTPGKPAEGFESYMKGTPQPSASQPGAASGPTPMEMARGPAISTSGISYNSVLAQAKQTQDSLGTVEQQLNEKNLKLKRSQSHLVRQKISDANGYIRAAGSKLGLQLPEGKTPPGATGISRFIAMINDGQDQLAQVQQQLNQMAASSSQMNVADMLAVQVKMGLATQEIEYTSTLLGKVIQSTTQLMNTQL